ncbi:MULTISPECIES: hypothetical protein [Actinomadura]|uniref:Helix-turn-helix transcriptional regulator n=1 Tax=Actinomadura yumaensis TaxID=111807 RepID=A0ABW2CVM3_9ACTN|nr:hypothetical protein [Actinomadura sp. J1-007]MWK37605.1 hypothetical protein [Actinomadura sp. J1-007]
MPTSDSDKPWASIGNALRGRRIRDLGVARLTDFQRAGGIGYRILTDLESGRRANFAPGTKAAIERAYVLPDGTLDRLIAGDWTEAHLRELGVPERDGAAADTQATAETPSGEPSGGERPEPAAAARRVFTLGEDDGRSLVIAAYDLGGTREKQALLELALGIVRSHGRLTAQRS